MTDKNRPQDRPSSSASVEEAKRRGAGLLGPQAAVAPYVGIAGFMTPQEVRAVAADAYTIGGFGTPTYGGRKLAIGVLASWKTLNGVPPGNPKRYPKIEEVRSILDAAAAPYAHRSPWQPATEGTDFDLKARCLRIIHYNSREPNLVAQLDRLCEAAGPNLDGFQLNIAWPPEEDVRWWADDHPTMRVILQVNRAMFSNVARNPQLLAGELRKKYWPRVTDFLFDMSGGTGASVDIAEATRVLEALYGAFGGAAAGGANIGIAGGLGPSAVVALKPLFERWPDLSIDAESGVRDKDDALDGEKARQFVHRALGVMPPAPPETRTTPA